MIHYGMKVQDIGTDMLMPLLLFLLVYITMLSDFVSLFICIGVCKKEGKKKICVGIIADGGRGSLRYTRFN